MSETERLQSEAAEKWDQYRQSYMGIPSHAERKRICHEAVELEKAIAVEEYERLSTFKDLGKKQKAGMA